MCHVVTCILKNENDEILILKRSNKVGTYKGQWSGVSGFVEEGEKPIDTAYKEIREETGLLKNQVEFIKKIKPVKLNDIYNGKEYNWIIHPFLFISKYSKINIDWEHTDYRWILPSKIEEFDTVPGFYKVVSELLK